MAATCAVCDFDVQRPLRIAGADMALCLRCNYIFLKAGDEEPDPNWMRDAGDFYLTGRFNAEEAVTAWKTRVTKLRGFIRADSAIRAVDYAAGSGFLVKAMIDEGCSAFGIEISPSLLDYARNQLKVPMKSLWEFRVDLASGQMNDSVDLLTTYHILEHLDRPRELHEVARQILKPGGVWSIEIPNIVSYESIRQGERWQGLSIGAHRGFMTARTFDYFLGDDFETIEMQTSVAGEFFSDFLPYLERLTADRSLIDEFASRLTGTNLEVTARKR